MGFSGVLCACVGIYLAAFILHCSYLRSVKGNQFYITLFMIVLLVIMVIGMASSALVHFFALALGVLLGISFYPQMP